MIEWTKNPPSEEGWYWWRDPERDDTDDPLEPEPVCIERSGHKPPYWTSWGLCPGYCPSHDARPVMALNLNHDGTGPVEEGYEDVEPFRGGEWWPVMIPRPPMRIKRDGYTLEPINYKCNKCGVQVYVVVEKSNNDGYCVGDVWCPRCSEDSE